MVREVRRNKIRGINDDNIIVAKIKNSLFYILFHSLQHKMQNFYQFYCYILYQFEFFSFVIILYDMFKNLCNCSNVDQL